jgi:hypothetical protein
MQSSDWSLLSEFGGRAQELGQIPGISPGSGPPAPAPYPANIPPNILRGFSAQINDRNV